MKFGLASSPSFAALHLVLTIVASGPAVGYSQEPGDATYVFVARASGCYRLEVLGRSRVLPRGAPPGFPQASLPRVFRLLPQRDQRRIVDFEGIGSRSSTRSDALGAWQVAPLPFPPNSSSWSHSGWEPFAEGDSIKVTWVWGYEASVLLLGVAPDTLHGVLERRADIGGPQSIERVIAIRMKCQ